MRRLVKAVVRVTQEYVGETSIDEVDYHDWLDGSDDTPEKVAEYLRAGEVEEDIADIFREAVARGDVYLYDSELVQVLS